MITKHQGKFAITTQFNGKFSFTGAGREVWMDDLTVYDLNELVLLTRRVLKDEYEEQLYRLESPMYQHAAQGTGWYGDDHGFERGGKEICGPGWRKFCANRERLEKLIRDIDPWLQAPTPRTYSWVQRLVKRWFKV